MSTTVDDFCTADDEIEELLERAKDSARSDREREFLDGLADRFEEYGVRMFLSQKQWDWLESIADR